MNPATVSAMGPACSVAVIAPSATWLAIFVAFALALATVFLADATPRLTFFCTVALAAIAFFFSDLPRLTSFFAAGFFLVFFAAAFFTDFLPCFFALAIQSPNWFPPMGIADCQA